MAPTAEVHTRLAGPCSPSRRCSVTAVLSPHRPPPPPSSGGWCCCCFPSWREGGRPGHRRGHPELPGRGCPGAGRPPLALWPLPLSYLGFGFGETKTGRVQGLPPVHPAPGFPPRRVDFTGSSWNRAEEEDSRTSLLKLQSRRLKSA